MLKIKYNTYYLLLILKFSTYKDYYNYAVKTLK